MRRGAGGETSGVDVSSLVAAGGSLNALASEAADTLEAFRSETVHGDEVEGACDPGSARCESVCDFSHHAVNNILRILNF